MEAAKLRLAGLLLAALVGCLAEGGAAGSASGRAELIDSDHNVRLETILAEVCKREIIIKIPTMHHKQISQLATVRALSYYFNSTSFPYEHEYRKCAKHNGPAVNRLLEVVEVSNENVCGPAKIELIKRFHVDYVSKLKKHARRRKKLGFEVPRILKNFFINYATLISDRCQENAMTVLGEASRRFAEETGDDQWASDEDQDNHQAADRNLHQLVSVWELVDALPWEKNERFSVYLSTEEPRVLMRVSHLENLPTMQGFCKRIRPLYQTTLLPLLRLLYMGYYPTQPHFKERLMRDRRANSFFQFLQMCEEVLPVQFLHGPGLAEDQVELVPFGKERLQWKEIVITADLMEPLEGRANTSWVGVEDLSELAGELDLEHLVKSTRSIINSRGGYMKSFLKKLHQYLKQKTRTRGSARLTIPGSLSGGSSPAASHSSPSETPQTEAEEEERQVMQELEEEEEEQSEEGGGERRVRRSNPVVELARSIARYLLDFLLYLVQLIWNALLRFPSNRMKAVKARPLVRVL